MATTVAVINDPHSNSTIGLANPAALYNDDGGGFTLSKGQRWLWECWLDFNDRFAKHAKKNSTIAIINGDTVELDSKKRTYQLHSRNPETAKSIAIGALDPLLDKADVAYFTRGTEAHVGNSANGEEAVAKNWGKSKENPNGIVHKNNIGNYSSYHINIKVDGVKINASHHTRMGNLPHTQRYYATKLAAEMIMYYATKGLDLPDIAMRAHVHRWSDSNDAFPNLRYIINAAWCLSTSFIHRIGHYEQIAEVGGTFIHVDSGKYEIEKIKYEPKGASWQIPKLPGKKS